jgi:hypothetical protein
VKRKPKRVMWLVFYHGPASTNITIDMQSAWNSKRAALFAIAKQSECWNYTVAKYVRADCGTA